MAINFPNSPSQGDTYTAGDTVWKYDGTAWNVSSYNSIVTLTSSSINALNDVDTTSVPPTDGQSLVWDNDTSLWKPLTISGGDSSGEANQNAFSNIAVTGQSTIQADLITDTLNIAAGTGISITTNDTTDTITITNTSSAGSSTFSGLADVTSANITIDKVYEPAIAMLRVDNVGTSAYTFPSHYSGSNPTIYAISGTTLAFDLSLIPGHPFEIQDNTLSALTSNLVHVATDGTVSTNAAAQGKTSGVLYWRIPQNANTTYVYQCQNHAPMFGNITVKDIVTL